MVKPCGNQMTHLFYYKKMINQIEIIDKPEQLRRRHPPATMTSLRYIITSFRYTIRILSTFTFYLSCIDALLPQNNVSCGMILLLLFLTPQIDT